MKVSLLLLIEASVFLLEADQQKPEPRDTSALIALAEKGNADAQFNLGLMYAKGNGVSQISSKRDFGFGRRPIREMQMPSFV